MVIIDVTTLLYPANTSLLHTSLSKCEKIKNSVYALWKDHQTQVKNLFFSANLVTKLFFNSVTW